MVEDDLAEAGGKKAKSKSRRGKGDGQDPAVLLLDKPKRMDTESRLEVTVAGE